METTAKKTVSAAVVAGRVFGVLAGVGGFVHGVGEALQGNMATGALWIESWDRGPIYQYMGGEPGISIVPNFLVTGILTMLAAVALIVVSTAFAKQKRWGWMIIGASAVMLVTGGGIGPPVMGILGGACALGVDVGASDKKLGGFKHALAAIWPYWFALTALVVAFVVVGSFLLVYLVSFNHPDVFSNSFLASIVLLIILNFSGRAYDAKRKAEDDGKRT